MLGRLSASRSLLAAAVLLLLGSACDGGLTGSTCAQAPSVRFGEERPQSDHRTVTVRFQSDCEMLAGTLYLPVADGPLPAAVFVHGSGEAGRLGIGAGWITTPLVEAGIAVFSYDKRGVGESGGECCPGDEGSFDALAADALAAVEALQRRSDIDARRVGLIGVSQAGWVIPIAAERSDDVAFTVLLSGAAVSIGEEILYSDLTGEDESTPPETPPDEIARRLADAGPSGFDPRPFLRAYRAPALWLFGARDQSSPTQLSVAVLNRIAADHERDFTVRVFPHLGHDVTHDPEAVSTMVRWIRDELTSLADDDRSDVARSPLLGGGAVCHRLNAGSPTP